MSRRMLVAGNWKMNLGMAGAVDLARGIAGGVTEDTVDVSVFPTFPWLVPVSDVLDESGIVVGAQNCYYEDAGAFTGEVSPVALSEICGAVLAGHSERRHILGESNELVGLKVEAILRAGMAAYLCVGETLDERQAGQAETVVYNHLESGLAAVDGDRLGRIVVAYEPVWAIGTGVAASADDAQEMCRSVREWLAERYGEQGQDVTVLYGGSVSPSNADELFACDDIDGGLIGGASLEAGSFLELVAAAGRAAAV